VWFGHEIQHQPDAVLGQLRAKSRQGLIAAELFARRIAGDGKSRAADIVLGEVRQCGLELGAPWRIAARDGPPAGPVCQTLSSQIQSKPWRAKPSIVAGSISARVTGRPRS